jgi:2-polyprenyl-3-methyl-5-hydroxy-6-metoxy-1,4-benzoquinol methylase
MSIIEQPAEPVVDEQAVEEFMGRVLGDTAGVWATVMSAIGDRLGLFRVLVEGAVTPAELAHRAGIDERYAREWCSVLASAGYIEHDAPSGTFRLPAAHAAVLADDGLASAGGLHEMTCAVMGMIDPVEDSFKTGAGVPYKAYPAGFWSGLERLTGTNFDHLLVQEWVPSIEGLEERLIAGADVADIGCGTGRALIRLAQAYPDSRFRGFDLTPEAIAVARASAEAAGVADRVAFEVHDVAQGIPGEYDLVTTFDVVHDSADPAAIVRTARQAVRPDGVWLVLEIHSHDNLDDAAGPLGVLLYGISVMHCMSVSIAQGGAALGTCGVPESVLRQLCLEAGFQSVGRIHESPLDVVYEVRP